MFCCDCHTAYAAEELLEGYSGQPQLPPTCRMCNGVIRPDVVLFGEMLSAKVCTQLSDLSCMEFNLVMSIGTSGVFQYIIEPVVRAWRQGVPTVEVNPSETSVSQIVDYRVRLGAAEAMGRIWECLKSK
jgi:NAD-dependent deacetylase